MIKEGARGMGQGARKNSSYEGLQNAGMLGTDIIVMEEQARFALLWMERNDCS